MGETKKLSVSCPDCGCDLVIDAATGEILSHRSPVKPLAGGASFDDLLAGIDRDKERAEQVFEREKAAMADRDRLMDEKFQEALKRAEEDPNDSPPKRPWDLD